MAVSGRKPLTMSTLQGSDEDMPVCLPCERGGRSVEAGGFCRTCNEHICQACYKSHLLPKPLANHVLLDKALMPRVAPPPDDMCTKHPTEQLEYYCKNHDKLECGKCVNIHHRTCKDVSYIQDICDDIEETEEFKTLYRTLTGIEHDVVQNKAETAANLVDIQTNIDDTKVSIHSFRMYLNQQLDKMEEALCEEADDIGIMSKKALENVSDECETLTSKVRSVLYSLDVSRKTQQKMRIFIRVKNTERIINVWQNQLHDIISRNKIQQYRFEQEKQFQDVIEKGKTMGHLVKGDDSTQSPGHMSVQSPSLGGSVQTPDPGAARKKPIAKIQVAYKSSEVKQFNSPSPKGTGTCRQSTLNDMTATRDHRINVKTQSCKHNCYITGSVLAGNNRLVVADHVNKSLKTVDLNQKEAIARLSLKHPPWDITRINENTLAVTCPDGGYIQLVRVSSTGTLTLDRQIQVDGKCHGIRYIDTSGGRLVVSFLFPHKVKVMDLSGTIVKDLSSDAAGQRRFGEPYHITISNDGGTLIVSNWGSDTVTGLTLDGVVKFEYTDRELSSPSGVAVGDGGEIYVCGYWSNNIHVISSEGTKIKVQLKEKDGVKKPERISYSDNKLFVGSYKDDNVDVYRIQYP